MYVELYINAVHSHVDGDGGLDDDGMCHSEQHLGKTATGDGQSKHMFLTQAHEHN